MTITIVDLNNVKIDGANAGQLCDVIKNRPEATSSIQVALVVFAKEQSELVSSAISAANEAAAALDTKLDHVETLLQVLSVTKPNDLPQEVSAAYEAAKDVLAAK